VELDKASNQKLAEVHPLLAEKMRWIYGHMFTQFGLVMRVTEGMRSFQYQYDLYCRGRQKRGNQWIVCDESKIVTHAIPGSSYHQYGLAVDSCFVGDDPYREKCTPEESIMAWARFGEAVKLAGLRWGGDWTAKRLDRPHAELSLPLSLDSIQMIYQKKGLAAVWERVNISMRTK
jgi:peptidoglycan L-alanyl-D-glutamate endopeptidase CwlK